MRYCDLSLPVPVDQLFTYELPESLRHRALPGARVVVPFGSRKLTGVILLTHDVAPPYAVKRVEKLLDELPVLDAGLLQLAKWIAHYYCAPLGEVLRSMAPTTAETSRSKVYTLTDTGRDVLRQLLFQTEDEEPAIQLLRLLERRSLSAAHLLKSAQAAGRSPKQLEKLAHPQAPGVSVVRESPGRLPAAKSALASLEKKGWITVEEDISTKDPLRAPAEQLRVRFTIRPEGLKLPKAERELLAFLELHPGEHQLSELDKTLKNASQTARSLARRQLLGIRHAPLALTSSERPPHALNPHQQAAFDQIRASLDARVFEAFLLQGVTGSGKTEVYLNAIEHVLSQGRSALLLVPEIALTPAVAGQFFTRFGDRVAILHSAFSDSERAEQWRRIRQGEATVVVATRSGVFAPMKNLGLLLVDEEHDGSYKQQEAPRYHGRDVAVVRASQAGATVVLGSATPSLETRYNVQRDKYKLIELPERVAHRPMPIVDIVDMRQEFLETRTQNPFSRQLLDALRDRLDAGEQSMLLLNRRGFSAFVTCRGCGERIECPNCAVTLTYHKRDRRLLCHYCSHAAKIPDRCPKCDSDYLNFMGTGAEKVEDELHKALPGARIARMDRDTITTKRHFETILTGFREKNYDILVGTQMIAKGHDIPNVTLVGLVNADIGLGVPDFRAAERTFQLLTQASGRAGRGDLPGRVILQTINPEHYAIRLAAVQDYPAFYEKEILFRRSMKYPPFAALANLLVRDEKQEDALRKSTELERLLKPEPEGMKVMGPAPAPVPRLKAEFRYQILIKASDRKKLNELLHSIRRYALEQKWGLTSLVIDVDPLSLQ